MPNLKKLDEKFHEFLRQGLMNAVTILTMLN